MRQMLKSFYTTMDKERFKIMEKLIQINESSNEEEDDDNDHYDDDCDNEQCLLMQISKIVMYL